MVTLPCFTICGKNVCGNSGGTEDEEVKESYSLVKKCQSRDSKAWPRGSSENHSQMGLYICKGEKDSI